MRIVLACDENYFPYVYVSILTLFESNQKENYKVTFIYQNVSAEKLEYLKILGEKNGRTIEILEFKMPVEYKKLPSYAASKTTYAKFLFGTLFPDDDKVLYLDPDTIVMKSIRLFEEIDMNNDLIAGVTECLPYYHKNASNMNEDDQYINGGMVLCNLRVWRRENFEEKAMKRLADTRLNLNYDQGVLNELCSGRIRLLPPKYNVLAEVFEFKSARKIRRRYGFQKYYNQKEIDEAVQEPVIIHFTGFLYGKPLSENCTHPYADVFRDKLNQCPWNIVLNHKELSKKQRIRKCVLHHFPFFIYLCLESILDIRRKYLLRKGKSC